MGKNRAGWSHSMVLRLEPSRGAAAAGYALMTVLLGGVATLAVLFRADRWPRAWRPRTDPPEGFVLGVLGVSAAMALLALVLTIANVRRWRIGRQILHLSNDPGVAGLMPDGVVAIEPPAAARPPLSVGVVKPGKLPRPPHLQRVAGAQNVIGRPPLLIAFLRLFENQSRTRTFVEGAWREFGHVFLLRSAASVSPSEFRRAKRSGQLHSMFIADRERLIAEINGADHRPLGKGRYRLRTVGAATLRVRDRLGSYPVTALLCHGAFWKRAVDELLGFVDVVVLDLSGFGPHNAGTQYELQRVVDRFPIERTILLADPRSNLRFLEQQLHAAWSRMAAGSPNATPQPRQATIAVVDRIAASQQAGQAPGGGAGSGAGGTTVYRLVARRKETRRLAAAFQQQLDSLAA